MEIDETIRVKTTFNQTQPNQDGNTITSKGAPPPPPSSSLSTSTSTSTSASSSTSEFGSIAPSQSQPPNGNLTHNYTFMSSNTALPSNMSQPLFTSAATPIGLSGSSPSSSSSFSSSLSSSSSTWFSSPSAKSNRLKRTSEQFEAIHENEEDVSISRPSAVKKFKPDSDDEEDGGEDILGTIASQDEMDDELGGRTNTINRHGVNDERIRFAGDDTDSSFMTLLSKLAQLEFPHRNPAQREACPLCPLTFPLEEFADHVYKCITKLDDDEKKEQERLDAKLATEMAFADARRESHRRPFHSNRSHHNIDRVEGNSMDEGGDDEDEDDEKIERERERDRGRRRLSGPAEIERELLEKFESRKLTECRYGSQCNRTDAAHFIQLSHPEVPCPICNETFAVYEINAHVTLCLESPKPPTIKQTTISDAAMKEDGSIPSSTSSGTTSNRSPPSMGLFGAGAFSSKPVSIPSFAGGDGISSSSSLTRRSRRPHRSVSANQITSNPSSQEDVLSPPLGLDDDELAVADDEADDDDYKSPTVPSTSASDDQARPIHRSTSDCSLSLAQAAAVANMVLKRKAAAQTSTSSSTSELNDKSEKDPSLLELLSTFSTLGFTRERLEEMHAQHQAAMENGNTNSNASSSSSKAATTASAAKID